MASLRHREVAMGGPTEAAGFQGHWLQTLKGRGLLAKDCSMKRLYGPDLLLPRGKTDEAFPVLWAVADRCEQCLIKWSTESKKLLRFPTHPVNLCQGFPVQVLPCGISASLHPGMPERRGDGEEQGTAERDRTAQLPDCGFYLASKMWQGPITTDTQTAKVSPCIQSYCLFSSFPPTPSFWKEECMPHVNFHSLSP